MTQGQLFPTPSEAPGGPYKGTNDGRPYTGARDPSPEPEYAKPRASREDSEEDVFDRECDLAHQRSLSALSTQQFTPITTLMSAGSGDFAPHTVGHIYEHIYSDRKKRDEVWGNYNWKDLHEDIARDGVTKPLWVHPRAGGSPGSERPALMNGHHRAMVAIDQGHLFVPTGEDVNGYDDPKYRGYRGY